MTTKKTPVTDKTITKNDWVRYRGEDTPNLTHGEKYRVTLVGEMWLWLTIANDDMIPVLRAKCHKVPVRKTDNWK